MNEEIPVERVVIIDEVTETYMDRFVGLVNKLRTKLGLNELDTGEALGTVLVILTIIIIG